MPCGRGSFLANILGPGTEKWNIPSNYHQKHLVLSNAQGAGERLTVKSPASGNFLCANTGVSRRMVEAEIERDIRHLILLVML